MQDDKAHRRDDKKTLLLHFIKDYMRVSVRFTSAIFWLLSADFCEPVNPCQNGGICSLDGHGYVCDCHPLLTDTNCSTGQYSTYHVTVTIEILHVTSAITRLATCLAIVATDGKTNVACVARALEHGAYTCLLPLYQHITGAQSKSSQRSFSSLETSILNRRASMHT